MKILLIGLGSIAKKHIDVLLEFSPKSEIYALRSSKNSNNIEGVISIYKVSDIPSNLDFILITNPTSLHAKSIEQILHLNKPIFIEKPIFHNVKPNESLINIINTQNIRTYIACNLRFHPSLIFLKKYVAKYSLKIYEVNIYCGSYLPDWRPGQNYRNSYSATSSLGGGVHLDLIHELDYCCWIFGMPLKTSSVKRKVSNLEIDSVDYCNYNLFYKNFNATIVLNYYRKIPKRIIEIVFENEIIVCDLLTSTIYKNEQDIIFKIENFNIIETYKDQMKYFINNLSCNTKYMNNINESFEILKIALNEKT